MKPETLDLKLPRTNFEYINPYHVSLSAVQSQDPNKLYSILTRKEGSVRRLLVLPAVLANTGLYERFVRLAKEGGAACQGRQILEITRKLHQYKGIEEHSELEEALDQLKDSKESKPDLSEVTYGSFERAFDNYYGRKII